MEFYFTALTRCVELKSSFNSQRDGILLYLTEAMSCTAKVSIPNGMEFYSIGSLVKAASARFNSQRDGILQWKTAEFTPL